jgi:hypothetical protein
VNGHRTVKDGWHRCAECRNYWRGSFCCDQRNTLRFAVPVGGPTPRKPSIAVSYMTSWCNRKFVLLYGVICQLYLYHLRSSAVDIAEIGQQLWLMNIVNTSVAVRLRAVPRHRTGRAGQTSHPSSKGRWLLINTILS